MITEVDICGGEIYVGAIQTGYCKFYFYLHLIKTKSIACDKEWRPTDFPFSRCRLAVDLIFQVIH